MPNPKYKIVTIGNTTYQVDPSDVDEQGNAKVIRVLSSGTIGLNKSGPMKPSASVEQTREQKIARESENNEALDFGKALLMNAIPAGVSMLATGGASAIPMVGARLAANPFVTNLALRLGGNLVGSEVAQQMRPMLGLQNDRETIDEALINTGMDYATGGAMRGSRALYRGAKALKDTGLKQTVANTLLNGKVNLAPETLDYIRENPQFPMSIGVAKGEQSGTDLAEKLLSPMKRKQQDQVRQGMLQKDLTDISNKYSPPRNPKKVSPSTIPETKMPEVAAGEMRDMTSRGFEHFQEVEDKTWNKFRAFGNAFKVKTQAPQKEVASQIVGADGKPIMRMQDGAIEEIAGPIWINRAKGTADSILSSIKKNYNKKSTEELFGVLAEEQKPLIAIMDRLAKTEGPIPIDVAVDLIRITGSKGFKNDIAGNVNEALFRKLRQELKMDGEESIAKWGTDVAKDTGLAFPKETLQLWRRANAITSQKARIFKDKKEITNMMDTSTTGKQDMKTILSDAQHIRDAIRSAPPGDRQRMKQTMQAEWLSDIQSRSTKDGQAIPFSNVLDTIFKREENAEINALFNGQDKQRLRNVFSVIKDVTENDANVGQQYVTIRTGTGAVSFAGDIFKSVMSGKMSTMIGSGAKTLTALLGGKAFIEKIALDPQLSRVAIELAKTNKVTPRTKALSRKLFLGLRGAELIVQTELGENTVVIDENGKAQITQPE